MATTSPDSKGDPRRDESTSSLILVVDPDPETRAMYVAALACSGWRVDSVTDGREALAKAISNRPAAIVTETSVPRLDGFALCRLLRHDPDTRHIPILVVTHDVDAQRRAAVEEAGADLVLNKPCLPAELVSAIETTLGTVRDEHRRRVVIAHDGASTMNPPALSKRFQRAQTTAPPLDPPELICPRCDRPLTYQNSYVGGVSAKHKEQWDRYECSAGCGSFQYRQRTRTLREAW